MMKPTRKLVLIEWVDSHAGDGWQPMDEILESSPEALYCRSVGWLVAENKECKVIVPNIAGEKSKDTTLHGCGNFTIPAVAIIKTTVLKY